MTRNEGRASLLWRCVVRERQYHHRGHREHGGNIGFFWTWRVGFFWDCGYNYLDNVGRGCPECGKLVEASMA